jgi:hypothetical protein
LTKKAKKWDFGEREVGNSGGQVPPSVLVSDLNAKMVHMSKSCLQVYFYVIRELVVMKKEPLHVNKVANGIRKTGQLVAVKIEPLQVNKVTKGRRKASQLVVGKGERVQITKIAK